MIDKYFGFKVINSDQSVIDSFLNHTNIDSNELLLLRDMALAICDDKQEKVDVLRDNILKIFKDTYKDLTYIEEQIIQSHFDFQKQHDLLRIFQRIEAISKQLCTCADHILIYKRLNGSVPSECQLQLINMLDFIITNHNQLKNVLESYEKNKHQIINLIHNIIENEQAINNLYLSSMEHLYQLANDDLILKGHMRALENIFLNLEFLGNTIESTATSLEWLLIS